MRQWHPILGLVACMAMTTTAHAIFHLMQIEQVVGGVGGDSTDGCGPGDLAGCVTAADRGTSPGAADRSS